MKLTRLLTKNSSLRFLVRESFRERKLYWVLLFIPVSAVCIGSILPLIISTVLSRLSTGSNESLTPLVVAFIATAVVGVLANRIGFHLLLESQALALKRVQNYCAQNLLTRSHEFYSNRMTGKLISDVNTLGESFLQFQDTLAINFLPFLTNMIIGIAIVSTKSLWLALGLLIMCSSVFAGALYQSRAREPYRIKRHAARRQLQGYFADMIINNQSVRIFGNEKFEEQQHGKLNEKLTKTRLADWKRITTDGNNRIISILFMQLIFVLGLIYSIQRDPSLLTVGIFAFAFTITLTNKMFDISAMIRNYENAIVNASSMVEILELPPDVRDRSDAFNLKPRPATIQFDSVTFAYETNEPLFKNFNLNVAEGEKVGLVGRSGGGKTSITKLLLRFHDIQSGKILINEQDISKVTLSSLKQSIAYVPQEPLMFHRSVHENIEYGKLGATHEEIIEVAKLAHAHEFIDQLHLGYDTLVGERGVKLSGGQRQRIAIARALLKNAPILVLDEATSALDSESEKLIQAALSELMKDKTVIVIAHRLSTIQKMDRIIVLDKGKISEEGSHKDLIANGNIYADLWSHQSGGFIEE